MPRFATQASGAGTGPAGAWGGTGRGGGRIWFETAVGEGTAFFIALQLAG